MTIPDPVSAIKAFLRADSGVQAVVPIAQIYAGEMPASEVDAQNVAHGRPAVIVAASGGPPDRGIAQIGRTRIDIRAYGQTPGQAMQVANAVHEALKQRAMRKRIPADPPRVTFATLIHGVTAETGPTPLRDADGNWPMVVRVYECLAAEVAA